LLLRLESFDCAPSVLASFLGLAEPVVVHRRNDGTSGRFAPIYREFLAGAALPGELLDEAYDSEYARHFYGQSEIAQFRGQWSRE
jgi:hypothetical protein